MSPSTLFIENVKISMFGHLRQVSEDFAENLLNLRLRGLDPDRFPAQHPQVTLVVGLQIGSSDWVLFQPVVHLLQGNLCLDSNLVSVAVGHPVVLLR